ncbi:hypothetical protein SUGI_0736480 [Cryptomeria japonica]|uniref:golgin candidate 2 n=1 Tax=Cryptomeria japonica TaxID=3369 RepID=UPI002414B523|nr:golgin candidate 2 [Cryptomeria japonica]GLJ36615.1 hypothetical protein SUGI_0736480 [Cryptomeria japonica]
MAGLLAWAADVVGGNGDGEEAYEYEIVPKFSPEEEDLIRRLNERSGWLEKKLEELRRRIPPGTIAHTLPHLLKDTLASSSALSLERNAHQGTRLQAQLREASLLEENKAYTKAIEAGQQQIQEKSHEARQLEAKLKEVNELSRNQRIEFEELQDLVLEREKNRSGNEPETGGKTGSCSSSPAATTKEDEIEDKRNELKFWEDKLIELEKKWNTLQHNLSHQLSPAQREKELERRLRSLTEQLMAKQTQLEALANERNALEFRLEDANEARRKLHLENGETNFKRNKVGRSVSTTSSALTSINARYDESKVHPQVSTIATRPRFNKVAGEFGSKIINAASDALGLRTGGYRRFMILRSLVVGYILGLHIVVFIIISFAKLV